MIGFYDYTVILTYISLASSILGMISACYARIRSALVFRSTRFAILSALASAL